MTSQSFIAGKHALLLFVGLTVFIAGCTTDSGVVSGPGVVITAFEPSFSASTIESGDSIQLRLRVQNQGAEEATNVVARLIRIDPNDWGLGAGTDIVLGSLIPPNPEFNTVGEEVERIYDLIAPFLPEGIIQSYNPVLRVYYKYRTTATKVVTVVNEDELRRLETQGLSLASETTQSSAGPLDVDMEVLGPIRVTSNFDIKRFPMNINIRNSGNGFVSSINSPIVQDDQIILRVDLPFGLDFESSDPTCAALEGGVPVFLFGGRDITVTCEVEITSPPLVTEDKTIIATLDYEYYTDRGISSAIQVKGTERASEFPF